MNVEEIVKKYWYIGAGVLAAVILMMPKARRRRRAKIKVVNRPRRRTVKKPRYVKKSPGQKPAWLVKGSEAARRRMARLRKMRRA